VSCLKHTNTHHGDNFTVDKPCEASCAALFTAALGPLEGSNPLPFAIDALKQCSAELHAFETVLFDWDGSMAEDILRRVLHGIIERARVAAEVAGRIDDANQSTGGAT